jgi:hypothetical protein
LTGQPHGGVESISVQGAAHPIRLPFGPLLTVLRIDGPPCATEPKTRRNEYHQSITRKDETLINLKSLAPPTFRSFHTNDINTHTYKHTHISHTQSNTSSSQSYIGALAKIGGDQE